MIALGLACMICWAACPAVVGTVTMCLFLGDESIGLGDVSVEEARAHFRAHRSDYERRRADYERLVAAAPADRQDPVYVIEIASVGNFVFRRVVSFVHCGDGSVPKDRLPRVDDPDYVQHTRLEGNWFLRVETM